MPNYITKDQLLVNRTSEGKIVPIDVNIGDNEEKWIQLTPLSFGEILKLGRMVDIEQRDKYIVELTSKHLITPKLSPEEILELGDNLFIDKVIGKLNEISGLKINDDKSGGRKQKN